MIGKDPSVLADKAYDAASLCEKIEAQGGAVVIPPRRHRKQPRDYDRIAYKNRWGIEGFFAKLTQWRRIATRYDKLAELPRLHQTRQHHALA